MTDQFVDVNAQLVTKRLEEERLQKLLTEQTGQLSDVLEVERELSRVQGEIEQAQGRQRLLEHNTAFATIELRASENPQPTWATQGPLPRQMASVLFDSWSVLLSVLRAGLLVGVAALPWIGFFGIPAGVAWWWNRRRRRFARAAPTFE